MKTMAIGEFKPHALRVWTEVAGSRESIVITRRGKPLVWVVPHGPPETQLAPGRLSGT